MLHNNSDLNHSSHQPSMEDILSSIRSIVSGNKKPGEWSQKDTHMDEEDILDLRHPVEHASENTRPSPSDGFLSSQTQDALMTALDPLKKINKSSSKDSDTTISTKSLEDVVREALKPFLKPFLKDWLDLNLPQLVQTIVREEISRVLSKK